jgi:DNA-binding beta-propeller fold protein YncE
MGRTVRVLLAAAILGACGTPAGTNSTNSLSAPAARPQPSEEITLATDRGLSVIAQSGATVRELPRGVAAPDWSVFYAVEPGPTTLVRLLDPITGAERHSIKLNGRYDLASAYRVAPTGLSRSGSVLALEAPPSAGRSAFAVIDTRTDAVKTFSVAGDMTIDVVSDDAASVYLVEHMRDNRYNVRLYDLALGKLAETPVVDLKQVELSSPDNVAKGLMAGVYHASVAGRLNAWYFSFYFNPGRNPFVHALNVTARYATCILDVPSGSGPTATGFWTLALAPNGRTLYATNPVQGIVTTYDAETLERRGTRELKRTVAAATAPIDPTSAAAISPEGYRLYVVAESGIVVIDTATLGMKAHLVSDRAVRSIALSADGGRLYALSLDGTKVWALDAMSGQPLATISVPLATSIARVR